MARGASQNCWPELARDPNQKTLHNCVTANGRRRRARKGGGEETKEETVPSCDVRDVFQVLLRLLQLINCGDGGTKRLPFAEAYKIPPYLLKREGGEGSGNRQLQ